VISCKWLAHTDWLLLPCGALILSRADREASVRQRIGPLGEPKRESSLNTPIRWHHPDGEILRAFELSNPDHPRELDPAPARIEWVEEHFGMEKLRSDYPHCSETAGH